MVIQDGGDPAKTMQQKQMKFSVKLAQLHQELATFQPALHGAPDQEITGVAMNSNTVKSGDLYAAVAGARHHGADYIPQALQAGAVAILTDPTGKHKVPEGVPHIVVDDVRGALAHSAAIIYGNLANTTPRLYGVTGTNGKTTTSYFLDALLTALGSRTGLIGTIETRIAGTSVPSQFTTPEAPDLHRLVRDMRHAELTDVVMEVSSHAMDYKRTFGLMYTVTGFTNLTQDHLDLHGSMADYFDAKAQLFHSQHSQRQVITLNGGAEPEWGATLAARVPNAVTLDLGIAAVHPQPVQDATWRIVEMYPDGLGHRFALQHRNGFTATARVGMPGVFNVANAALAATMVFTAHDDSTWPRIAQALDTPHDSPFSSAVPGRMEVIHDAPTVIVDFAHNPDGLTQALQAVNRSKRPTGKTLLVFGATGDRDTAKRPLMGRIAAQHADIVIVTDDDPHYEDAAQIRRPVTEAAQAAAKTLGHSPQVMEIAPRATALEHAVAIAQPQDTILAAGRGHETHQDIAGQPFAIDDRVVLRKALQDHGIITTGPALPHGTD